MSAMVHKGECSFAPKLNTEDMIVIDKLTELENISLQIIKGEKQQLKAVRKIRELFAQVDFSAEEIPLSSKQKLIDILHYMKGEPLTVNEIIALGKIVEKS